MTPPPLKPADRPVARGPADRPVAGWPPDRPLAVSLSIMLEGWAEGSAPGIGPMGNPLKPGGRDLQALSWAEYGPKVGVWRLLDLLDRAGRKAVFYISGVVAERYPDLPAAIAERGHAVAAHAWCQGTLPPYMSPEAEWQDIVRCRDVLAVTAGTGPLGWLIPRCTPSLETSAILNSGVTEFYHGSARCFGVVESGTREAWRQGGRMAASAMDWSRWGQC